MGLGLSFSTKVADRDAMVSRTVVDAASRVSRYVLNSGCYGVREGANELFGLCWGEFSNEGIGNITESNKQIYMLVKKMIM